MTDLVPRETPTTPEVLRRVTRPLPELRAGRVGKSMSRRARAASSAAVQLPSNFEMAKDSWSFLSWRWMRRTTVFSCLLRVILRFFFLIGILGFGACRGGYIRGGYIRGGYIRGGYIRGLSEDFDRMLSHKVEHFRKIMSIKIRVS